MNNELINNNKNYHSFDEKNIRIGIILCFQKKTFFVNIYE